MATIDAEQQAALQQADAERATAAPALQHLMPLRTGRAAERFPDQLEQIFTELGRVTDQRTMENEQNAAVQRSIQEAEAAAQWQATRRACAAFSLTFVTNSMMWPASHEILLCLTFLTHVV